MPNRTQIANFMVLLEKRGGDVYEQKTIQEVDNKFGPCATFVDQDGKRVISSRVMREFHSRMKKYYRAQEGL